MVLEAITKAGYQPGKQIGIALDPYASERILQGRQVHLQKIR